MEINKPILLIGDSCTDKFVYCKCERLCPEAPVPLLDIIKTKTNKGMAGNVLKNLESLGCETYLLTNKNYKSIVKTRYVDHKTNHMFIRIDTKAQLKSTFKDYISDINFDDYSAVVISDYDKGFITAEEIQFIGDNHSVTFLDTKKILDTWAESIKFIKINRKEYNQSEATLTDNLKNKIITTLGSGGALYKNIQYDVEDVEVKDLSGAGDTFLSGLVCKFLTTNNLEQSSVFANKCATNVVQRKGVNIIQKDFLK
jgi:D-beta-D-heptose 7-phosphate kinase/D-beta-D-heptose 1-phosphate adenosyltransferase